MAKKRRKKVSKKTSKKKVSKKRTRKASSGIAKISSLAKKPLGKLLTLQSRVAKAMEMRVKKAKKLKANEGRSGIVAGLFAGPQRPSKEDRAVMAARTVLDKFSSASLARLASRAGD